MWLKLGVIFGLLTLALASKNSPVAKAPARDSIRDKRCNLIFYFSPFRYQFLFVSLQYFHYFQSSHSRMKVAQQQMDHQPEMELALLALNAQRKEVKKVEIVQWGKIYFFENFSKKKIMPNFSRFGVCCLFLVTSTSTTINQNCTYIRNPSYPSVYSATTALTYTINKCSSDVCAVRLDFESFTIEGPSATTETNGGACTDSFVVSVRKICDLRALKSPL